MSDSRAIQLIWDFRGPEASHTAQHYQKHLEEFLASYLDRTAHNQVGVIQNQEFWYSCTLSIDETQLETLKNSLKPHRGVYL
ncbi:MAG: hypothetical protein ACO3FD_02270 [Flavobacteriaceae bacterium]|jgi:hypothetical protein